MRTGATKSRLICVVDESGASNLPGREQHEDFCFGGVVFSPEDAERLSTFVVEIGEVLGRANFKYKHLIRSREGRQHFINALADPTLRFDVWGFYVSGNCLAREAERSLAAVLHFGSGDGEVQREAITKIATNPRKEMIASFLQYGVMCPAATAHRNGHRLDMYVDQRSDAKVFEEVVREHLGFNRDNGRAPIKLLAEGLNFTVGVPVEFRSIALLADIFAGDIRYLMKSAARFVDPYFVASGLPKDFPPMAWEYHKKTGSSLFPVAYVHGPFAPPATADPSSKTPLFSCYETRLLKSLLAYGSADGIMAQIEFQDNRDWALFQLPD